MVPAEAMVLLVMVPLVLDVVAKLIEFSTDKIDSLAHYKNYLIQSLVDEAPLFGAVAYDLYEAEE